MAILQKDTIIFSSGKELMVPQAAISINRRLELSDYYSRQIFFCDQSIPGDKKSATVVNIHRLSRDEIIEIADCMIQLWIDLKDNLRVYGNDNPSVFQLKRGDK